MTGTLAAILMAAAVASAAGSAPALQVEGGPHAMVTLRAPQRSTALDLQSDVVGCKSTLYDNSTGQSYPAGVGWTVLDVTRAGSSYYVLLLAETQSNCNIQGHCGASQDHTVVLLSLTADLKLVHKHGIAIDHCVDGTYSAYWHDMDFAKGELQFIGDVLTIEFKTTRGEETTSERIVYDRSKPEQGLQSSRTRTKAPTSDSSDEPAGAGASAAGR